MGLFLQPDHKWFERNWILFNGENVFCFALRTESLEASYSTEVKTTSTETKTKSRPAPDRDETKTLRGWDQVKMKNSTNYRKSSNWSEISTFQEKTPAEDKLNNTPFPLFQLPTHNFPLWGRDKTDQDRVKMQSSPRRDGDGLLTTTNTNQYLWQVPPQLPVCKKQLLQSIVQKYCFIQLNVHIQQWKYTLLTATANYALLNKHGLHEDK